MDNVQVNALLFVILCAFFLAAGLRIYLHARNVRHLKRYGDRVPEEFSGIVDQGMLKKMRDYTLAGGKLGAAEDLFSDILILAVLFSGILPWLTREITSLGLSFIPSGILFFFACSLFLGLFDLPFDLYRTFVIEKRFSFSTITFPMWLSDLVKTALISAVVMDIFLSVFFGLIMLAPTTWWLWSWIFFVSFQMLMSWLYPVVIAPLFNKFEPLEDKDLLEKISDLAARSGIAVKGIFRMDAGKRSRHSNAYFTGIGKSKRIVLFDTLIQGHTMDELLSVLAHEIGHWKKGHIKKQILMSMAVSFVLLYGAYLAVTEGMLYSTFGFSGVTVYAGLFLLSLILKPAAYLLSPLGAMISRRFERQADAFAYEQIGSAEAMVSALKQLATQNLSNLHPDPVYAWFMYSHPPLVERIRFLNGLQQGRKG